ncbi:carbohydrate ABC transporter permease [Kitasatospora sp. NPDC048365]|uniref:carbohydrate ABC transporter permease n=1 Tax=Kitasatospora sp. NPDC048365 TaxID=3364050 RepID=UPI00371D66E1
MTTPRTGTAGCSTTPRSPNRTRAHWWLLTPAGVVMLTVTVAPIAFLVCTSFTDYSRRSLFTGAYRTVGLQQYTELLTDAAFWHSLARTVLFTAAMVAGSIAVGTYVAQLMTRVGRTLRTVLTVVMICAWAMPTVASSLVWNWLFQPGYGVVNWLLTQLRVFGDMTSTDWSNDPALAYLSIWLLVVWQAVPFIALTLYAALTQLPAERQEAARLDGAGEWRLWWNITLPFLRPTLMLVTLMSVIWDFNVFNQIWLVSAGGPDDATTTLGIFAYRTAFVGFHIGQGAALSVVTTAILVVVSAFYIRGLLRSGEDL